MIHVYGNGVKNGQPVIHASHNAVTDNIKRIKPVCGQPNRRVYYTPVDAAKYPVNCVKCLTV